ncbi:hypothetical protein [Enterovirga rhinocerotis]|uniref:Uncharacterized protein n=1 Tax=Enterovirga rhinocerotis TaxID=1339210 RepID=A0A4R7C4Y1_9HYPH|nr:hypothetical protein [Enterovirga rhinocerotis]TDR93083.1 hypothetical protein EV668_0335 [Enterovirga rhinocerotis]
MDFTGSAMALVGIITAAGAGLGAAIAHWRRGPGHLAIGAIIGGLSTFLFALVATVYAGIIVALGLVALAVLVLGAFFG